MNRRGFFKSLFAAAAIGYGASIGLLPKKIQPMQWEEFDRFLREHYLPHLRKVLDAQRLLTRIGFLDAPSPVGRGEFFGVGGMDYLIEAKQLAHNDPEAFARYLHGPPATS